MCNKAYLTSLKIVVPKGTMNIKDLVDKVIVSGYEAKDKKLQIESVLSFCDGHSDITLEAEWKIVSDTSEVLKWMKELVYPLFVVGFLVMFCIGVAGLILHR